MDLVLRNPFRVLGLPVTASSREIAKRVSDLELFSELGKQQSYPRDFPEMGEIDRSTEAIKDAARRIELPEMRVFHSFFWFRDGDTVDELAFECLANFDLLEADSVWTKQLEKVSGIGKVAWRVNRAVFSIWMADDLNNSTSVYFEQALQDIAFSAEDLYEQAIAPMPGSAQASPQKIRELIADALIDMAVKSTDEVYGPNAVRITEHCLYFHDPTLAYISAKLINPLTNAIHDAVQRSKVMRDEGTSVDDLRRKNGLSKVENIIYALRDALGEDDAVFQATANSFANEVIACAINAINQHKAVPTALVLAEWAAELPSYGQTQKWLLEQREKIFSWDPEYESEDDPYDFQNDSESYGDDDEQNDQESEQSNPPKRIPTRTTVCPGCSKRFEPQDVVVYTEVGVRCPYCSQSIVI